MGLFLRHILICSARFAGSKMLLRGTVPDFSRGRTPRRIIRPDSGCRPVREGRGAETGMLRTAPHLFERPKRWGRKSRQEGGPSWNAPKRAFRLYSLLRSSRAWRMRPKVHSTRAIFLRMPWKAGCGAGFRRFAASSRWAAARRNQLLLRGISSENGLPVRPFSDLSRGRTPRRPAARVCGNRRGNSRCRP